MDPKTESSRSPHSPSGERFHEKACGSCGRSFIGKGGCPNCGHDTVKVGQEMTFKTFAGDNDLIKGR